MRGLVVNTLGTSSNTCETFANPRYRMSEACVSNLGALLQDRHKAAASTEKVSFASGGTGAYSIR